MIAATPEIAIANIGEWRFSGVFYICQSTNALFFRLMLPETTKHLLELDEVFVPIQSMAGPASSDEEVQSAVEIAPVDQ